MPDRWSNLPIICRGGIRLDIERQVLGTEFPGAATILQNYEPSINGGYERIKGFTKYSSIQVPGTGNILAVQPALGGVFAVRKTGTDNALYYSTGAGWGSILNTTTRTGSPTKARIFSYNIVEPAIILTDGVNPAGKFNGTTYTHLNSSGAPTAPKYAETFKNRVVLAPATTSSSFVLSAPADDEDFTGGAGAVEIKVGDTITGLRTFRESLYIFCTKSIYKLTGNTSSDFVVDDVTTNIGCLGHDTIQESGGDLIYLSQTGIRSLAATERTNDLELGVVSKGIQPTLVNFLNKDETAYSSVTIPTKNQYRLFVYDANLGTSTTKSFLGKLTDTPIDPKGIYEWAEIVGVRAYTAGSTYDDDSELAVFSNADDGFVYRMESGDSFDGANIQSTFQTPYVTFGNSTIRKVLHKVDLFTQLQGDLSLTLNVLYDNSNDNVLQPPSQTFTSIGNVSRYGTAVYGTSRYRTTVFSLLKNNLIGAGFTAAFKFTTDDTNSPHRIDTLDVSFAGKGRR